MTKYFGSDTVGCVCVHGGERISSFCTINYYNATVGKDVHKLIVYIVSNKMDSVYSKTFILPGFNFNMNSDDDFWHM